MGHIQIVFRLNLHILLINVPRLKKKKSNITKSCHLIGWNGGKHEYSNLCDVEKTPTILDVNQILRQKTRKVSDTIKLV